MELFRSWGLEAKIRAAGMPEVEWLGLVTQTLEDAGRGEPVPLGLPTKEQASLLSPTAPLCAPQYHTEAVLLSYARSLGASVEFGREVVRVDVGDDGVEAVVREGDRNGLVCARYLIGADGAHSVVRNALGIEMRGTGAADAHSVSAAFTAPLWDVVGQPRYGLYPIVHPGVSSVFVPSGHGDEWVFGVAPDLLERPPNEVEMTRLIRIAAGVADLEPRIHRITTFTFTAEIADRFADRSAFLIGDAAHRVTPRGGTGMNTAIADGHNLGWKLGWVLKGWGGETLLDSYEAERRPVALHNVERSIDERGSYRDPVDEIHVDLGGRIAHLWVETERGRESTLDLIGDGLTLFTGPASDQHPDVSASAYRSAPVTVRRLPAVTARALGIAPGGSLFVTPSGVPSQVWRPGRQKPSRSRQRRCLPADPGHAQPRP
jgi:2-polyprenyl-6-methoxyphenol hydroxylase-like FAD-dependent oxidoreductase